MLDFWGTPYEQTKDFHNLNIKQYWTPYNNLYNSFLGFAIRGPPRNLFPKWKLDGSKRPPGKYKFLLWGKLPKYFSEKHYELIDKIMKKYNLEAVATIHDEKKQVPSIITNLGIVEHGVWEKTLAESVFVMGFGDPIMGPTPLEGIAAGCAYLNPLFPETKTLGMNRKMPLDSQHPQVRDIYGGEPYVYDIILENHDHVLATIGRVLENLDKGLIKPYVPYDYTIEAITAKVANDLATRPEMSNDKFIFIP
jgi:alpha-1,3(6)-mannosylglycoprotein beta-1,6-N-acetyl-glucosaminyltransferase